MSNKVNLTDRTSFIAKWNAIAKVAHNMATEKGFHEKGDDLWTGTIAKNDLAARENAAFVEQLLLIKELALIGTEIGEAVEAVRSGSPNSAKVPHLLVVEELADVVIRIMDTSAKRGWPLGEAIVDKIAFNADRERLHGKKF